MTEPEIISAILDTPQGNSGPRIPLGQFGHAGDVLSNSRNHILSRDFQSSDQRTYTTIKEFSKEMTTKEIIKEMSLETPLRADHFKSMLIKDDGPESLG